jgi:thioredoxin reductase
MKTDCEVLIVGGGPAGLSAAMALGRMGREVLVCDDARPRNAASEHINNLPSQDGIRPADWRQRAQQNLRKYPTVHFHRGAVTAIERADAYFRAQLSAGLARQFRKVILAHGVLDTLPSAPGFRELWGKSVFHCPYCHGHEVRDTRLGLVANGPAAEHLLPMVAALSKDTILFTNGDASLTDEFRRHVQARHIELVEGSIKWLARENERLEGVVLKNGDVHARENLFVAPATPYQTQTLLGDHLGCEKNEMGLYKIGVKGNTTVEGVFAAGDIATGHHSVLGAAASGQLAGAGVASELLHEAFALG